MNYQKSYKGKGESVINYDTKQAMATYTNF